MSNKNVTTKRNGGRKAAAAAATSQADVTTFDAQVYSIADYMAEKGYVTANPCIYTNTNGYPFICFITADNISENIYFSKNASLEIEDLEFEEFDDADRPLMPAGFLAEYQIVMAESKTNAGLTLPKLCKEGSGNRVSIDFLLGL